MKRSSLINKYFQKKDQLTINNPIYTQTLTDLWNWLITADRIKDDITTNTLELKGESTAHIVAKQPGIIAGLEEIIFLISRMSSMSLTSSISDSALVKSGATIATLTGPVTEILKYERTILNILGRMSGIATETHNITTLVKNKTSQIAATRKTPWMWLDKKAVAVGGGLTHRLSLSDSILIKDNHLTLFPNIKNVLQKAFEKSTYAELEVATPTQAHTALKTFSLHCQLHTANCILTLMLDNWKPHEVKKFLEKIKTDSIYDRVLFEASGEINQKNVKEWSQTGVDILSIGSLTHSPKNFNLSMRIDP